jgi:hypothetical protein
MEGSHRPYIDALHVVGRVIMSSHYFSTDGQGGVMGSTYLRRDFGRCVTASQTSVFQRQQLYITVMGSDVFYAVRAEM